MLLAQKRWRSLPVAGAGLAAAMALKFAGEGAAEVVAARTKSGNRSGGRGNSSCGEGAWRPFQAMSRRKRDCERLICEAASQFCRVDILVNNAGEYGPVMPVEEISPGRSGIA